MAQHDYDIANQSFPAFRTDLNNVLGAINSSNLATKLFVFNKGISEKSTIFPEF